MLKVIITYPTRAEERVIMDRMSAAKPKPPEPIIDLETVLHAQSIVHGIYVDEKIKNYVLDIIFATRQPAEYGFKKLRRLIEFGASPRATIFMIKAAKAHAFLAGRGYVTPDDIKEIAPDVLRHRIIVSFEAQAEAITTDHIIQRILDQVEVP